MASVHNSQQNQLNEENDNQIRKHRKDVLTARGGVAAMKRTVLGTITNQVRKQPPRAAKPKGSTEGLQFAQEQDENAYARQKHFTSQPSFQIYVDQPVQSQSERSEARPSGISQSKEVISAALTALPLLESRIPLPPSETDIADEVLCISPMVLDTSADEERLDRRSCIDLAEAVIRECPEYAADILVYMRQAEKTHRAKPGYIDKQPDITPNMRSILVDWMVEVSEEYNLQRETLFLAVNYIDRFLSHMSVLRGKLQLVGTASMFLAAKYEEIYPPDINEFVYITDDTYNRKQVLRMEHLILKVLLFHVAVPTINWFSEKFLRSTSAEDKLISLTMFLCELSLIDVDPYIQYLPSTIAASALFTARATLGMEPWPRSVAEATEYSVRDLSKCVLNMYNTFSNAPSHQQQAVREKYKHSKYHEVANLRPPPNLHAVLQQLHDVDLVELEHCEEDL